MSNLITRQKKILFTINNNGSDKEAAKANNEPAVKRKMRKKLDVGAQGGLFIHSEREKKERKMGTSNKGK